MTEACEKKGGNWRSGWSEVAPQTVLTRSSGGGLLVNHPLLSLPLSHLLAILGSPDGIDDVLMLLSTLSDLSLKHGHG